MSGLLIPDGMTEEEVMKIIHKVSARISPRYVFYGYSANDLRQESFIICMDAMDRYVPPGPLENFLSTNLSNRLKNFVRKQHFLHTENPERVKVLQPAQLDGEETILDEEGRHSITYEDLDYKEMISVIDIKLPANIRMDYLKMINDVYITKKRKAEITAIITDILEESGHYEKPGEEYDEDYDGDLDGNDLDGDDLDLDRGV